MKKQRSFAMITAAALAIGLVGCSGGESQKDVQETTAKSSAAVQQTEAQQTAQPTEAVKEEPKLAEMPETVSIFCKLSSTRANEGITDLNEVLPFQMIEELTGTHVEWIHPTSSAVDEKFNLAIASGQLPDLMCYGWDTLDCEMYVEDEIIIELSDLIKENMPNLSAYLDAHPEIKNEFSDDEGNIYYIPLIRQDDELKVFRGPQIRMDWLEKLNLEVPTTPDELYDVLMAFKTQDPNGNGQADEIPMSGVGFDHANHGIDKLLYMFGTTEGFYVKDGQVKFGILENELEEGLAYMTKLYKDGLMDIDYLINDRTAMDGKVLNDEVGYIYSMQPSTFYNKMQGTDKVVLGIPHISAEGVTENCFDAAYAEGCYFSYSIAVTTANKNPEGSLRWLDTFFGEEGKNIMNFGQEGLTHEMVDGVHKLTDFMTKNPDGKSLSQMGGRYLGVLNTDFPTIQTFELYSQSLTEWGKNSIETWAASANIDGLLPSVTLTPEENAVVNEALPRINTYVDEAVNKIIVGTMDISELPKIREEVNKMGIEDVITVYQQAYERYLSR